MQLENLLKNVATSSLQAGRNSDSVQLLAVTKNQHVERIKPLLEQGQKLFGENRVQEASLKWPSLKKEYPDIELHLIGHLQSNKAKEAVALFDVIQTLDSVKLAEKLANQEQLQNKALKYYIEVNIAREAQKSGVYPEDVADFLASIRREFPLKIIGVMCIPPQNQDPRPYFQSLAKIALTLDLPEVSMGMSDDYQIAIEEGATIIRVGRALFTNS